MSRIILRQLMRSIYVLNWERWKELCSTWDYDPYETIEFGVDEGGGNSTDYEYIAETPKKEE